MILRLTTSLVSVLFAMQFLKCGGYSYFKPMMFGEADCIDDNWESHPIGTTWYDNKKCEKLECIFSDDILFIQGFGCSTIGSLPECQRLPGYNSPYPGCCPKVKCPDGTIW